MNLTKNIVVTAAILAAIVIVPVLALRIWSTAITTQAQREAAVEIARGQAAVDYAQAAIIRQAANAIEADRLTAHPDLYGQPVPFGFAVVLVFAVLLAVAASITAIVVYIMMRRELDALRESITE